MGPLGDTGEGDGECPGKFGWPGQEKINESCQCYEMKSMCLKFKQEATHITSKHRWMCMVRLPFSPNLPWNSGDLGTYNAELFRTFMFTIDNT